MGVVLETVQHLCDDAGAALWIVTHQNRKQGQGVGRILGAGPAEWGRVLLTAEVKARHTDPVSKATSVLTELSAIGGEIPDATFRVRRRIWADDPDDLESPLHVETTVTEVDEADAQPAADTLTPAAVKLLEAARSVGPASGTGLVDWIAKTYGHGLRRETVSRLLADLERRGLLESAEDGRSKLWNVPPVTCDITRPAHM
jgi:CRP-like cAMP-binding protein